jgi:hypothetical protein
LSKPTINYYLDHWTDEVIPCAPTLEAWAAWLDKPDPDWFDRELAAAPGDEYDGMTLEVLGDVRAEWQDGEFVAVEPVPDGTSLFFMRHSEGGSGWDAEQSGETIKDAADGLEEGDGPLWFACVREGPSIRLRFDRTPEGPTLTVIATIQ